MTFLVFQEGVICPWVLKLTYHFFHICFQGDCILYRELFKDMALWSRLHLFQLSWNFCRKLFWFALSSISMQQTGCNSLHGWLTTEASGVGSLCNIRHLRHGSPVNALVVTANKTALHKILCLPTIHPPLVVLTWPWKLCGVPKHLTGLIVSDWQDMLFVDRMTLWCTIRAGRSFSMVGLHTAKWVRGCPRGLS